MMRDTWAGAHSDPGLCLAKMVALQISTKEHDVGIAQGLAGAHRVGLVD
jgi:hypothetical protein